MNQQVANAHGAFHEIERRDIELGTHPRAMARRLQRGAFSWHRALAGLVALGVGLVGFVATPRVALALPSTFTVNTVADHVDDGCVPLATGDCTLREALAAANATTDNDTIAFDIPGPGIQTIRPTSNLPFIVQPLIIDATSQHDYAGTPLIELDGSLYSGGIGLWAFSAVTIQGLTINRFGNRAVLLDGGSDGSVVRANYLGTTADGTAAAGNFSFDALELRSSNNTVGGTSPGDRNVIVGLLRVGPFGGSVTGNVVQGNFIGTNATGTAGINYTAGIVVDRTTATMIGGTSAGAGNVISGNPSNGIQIDMNATGTVVQGNFIGTNAGGTAAIPNTAAGMQVYGPGTIIGGSVAGAGNVVSGNGGDGIRLQTDHATAQGNYIGTSATGGVFANGGSGISLIGLESHDNTVGGTAPGAGNTIANNDSDGITVLNGTHQTLQGNAIFDNVGLAIDLNNDGVTSNDIGDVDGGPNDRQNFPVVMSATSSEVTGTVASSAATSLRVELFASPACDVSGHGEGARFVTAIDVVTDGSGDASFTAPLSGVTGGEVVTATATSADGNTSELSACAAVGPPDADADGVVNSLDDADDGACTIAHCSLREAITSANGSAEVNEITFAVAGTISPTSPLPSITAPVTIDGGTLPDCAGTPAIILHGTLAGAGSSGLNLVSGGSTVRGLVINGWDQVGIRMWSDGNTVQCNRVGTNAAGTAAVANRRGVEVNGNDNRIGGTGSGQGNLLSGNTFQGVDITGLTSTGNRVEGNRVGTDVSGLASVGNGLFGVLAGGVGNIVGGSAVGARNVISGNSNDGVRLPNGSSNNRIEGNWIGVDAATGTTVLANTANGVFINGVPAPIATGNVIAGNVIGGNSNSGVQLSGPNAQGNTIEGNLIGVGADGVTAVRNGPVAPAPQSSGWGVIITGPGNVVRDNTIANNGTGVQVGTSLGSTEVGVTISENRISDNGALGIDLVGDGVTPNDSQDGDGGPNALQNFPVLSNATATQVDGTIDSTPGVVHRVEVFASGACDSSGNGEGARFVGATNVTTNAGGHAAFTVGVADLLDGDVVTATATNATGSTSEFSPCVPFDDAPAVGRVRVGKVTEPSGGAGFEFVGPAGGDGTGGAPLGAGDAVVFVRNSGPGLTSLHLLDVGSGDVTPIAGTSNASYPEFSPDNSRIAFVVSTTLRVLDVASGDVDTIVTGLFPQSPSWSPDGAWIVFHSSDQLWVVPSDGSEAPTQVTTGTASIYAAWGPDGTIAFRSNQAGGFIRVATFDVATRSLVGVHGLANSVGFHSQQREMHWSPDGSRIVAGGAFNAASNDDLFLVPADGVASVQQLTNDAADETWPTWSADGSTIVFASDRNGGNQLFRMPADLSAPAELLVDDVFSDYQPDWGRVASQATYVLDDGGFVGGVVPAGTPVTFTELAKDGWYLATIDCGAAAATIDLEAGTVTVVPGADDDIVCTYTNIQDPAVGRVRVGKVTEPSGGAGFEFVGPAGGDGTGDAPLGAGDAVVFVRFTGVGSPSLHLLDVESGDVTPIAGTSDATYPEFSPDNSRIAFGVSSTLRVLDVASGDVETIVTGLFAQSPSWSPDGAWIVFYANDQLWVVPSDGSEAPTQVTSGTVSTSAAWGPDGTIAFRSNQAGGFIRVATFDVATRSLVGVHGLANSVGFASQHREMHWSPDGSRIVAGGAVNAASNDDLFLVPADGVGSVQQLTNDAADETWPTWSADGSTIVFASNRNGGNQLFRMPADLSAPAELLVDDVFSDYQPDWGRVASQATYVLDDGGFVGGVVPAGTPVTFTELAKDGWHLASIDCGAAAATIDLEAGTVTVVPGEGDDIVCTYTNIQNDAPPVAEISGPLTVVEGSSIVLSGAGSSDVDGTVVSYAWTASAGATLDDASAASPSLTGIDDATVTVTLTVTDDDGLTHSTSTVVTVTNAAPVVDAGPDLSDTAGATVTLSASFTDAGALDTHSATVDWGDGTPLFDVGAVVGSFSSSHTFGAAGTYTVTVCVTDDDDGVGCDTSSVVVVPAPVPPVAVISGPATVVEGSSIVLSGAQSSDADGTIVSYAWTASAGATLGDASAVSPSLTGVDDATVTVTLTVTDEDGLTHSSSKAVTVTNAAPVVNAGPNLGGNLGVAVTMSVSFTDAGTIDTHSATVNWGDGTPLFNAGAVSSPFARSHTYSAAGSYTVTVCTTDDDGGVGCDTVVVAISAVVLPQLTISAALLVAEPNSGTVTRTMTVRLKGAYSSPVTVQYRMVDGTAVAGGTPPEADYVAATGVLTFTPGGSRTQPVSVTVNGDLYREQPNETFVVELHSASNAVIENATGTVTIDDADDICTIVGTVGPDVLIGTDGADVICALAGNDLVDGRGGNDRIFGDAGIDRITFDNAPAQVVVDLLAGTATGWGSDQLASFEDVVGSAFNDRLSGTEGPNTMIGNGGPDTVIGRGGVDEIFGNDGDDELDGGSGNDVLWGGTGDDAMLGGDDDDTLRGSIGADSMNGNNGNDTLEGEDGGDNLLGGDGVDRLFGGAGDDTMFGGVGNDTMSGGADDDTMSGDAGNDTMSGDTGDDTLSGGTERDTLSGGDGVDTMSGGDGNDTMSGGDGNDTMFGRTGVDTMSGDAGNDTMSGDEDNDKMFGGVGNDTMSGDAGNDTMNGDEGNDVMSGNDGDDTVHGNDGDDQITGGAGVDKVYGDAGSDELHGGQGANKLFGGSGDDYCSFGPPGETRNSCERP